MPQRPPAAPPLAALLAEAMQCHRAGDLARAEALYARIQAVSRNHPAATLNHALIMAATGRARPAAARLQALLKAHPDHAAAHRALAGLLAADAGPTTASLYHLRRAAELDPAALDAWLALIEGHAALNRPDDARRAAQAAMARFPDRPEPQTQLAVAAIAAGDRAEARRLLDAAVARHPSYAPALYNLARLCDDAGDMAEAIALYRRARQADPDFEPAAFNGGELALRTGAVAEAIACFDASLARQPADPAALSARLMAAQYVPGVTAADLAALHALYQARVGAALAPAVPAATVADPARRLRVGLVSADLHEHPVGIFLIRAVEAMDRAAIDLVAYAAGQRDDAIGRRFRAAIGAWRDIAAWSDDRLAEAVRRDRIDILIDLAGHTRDNRLPAFARRPAPLQLTWAGYVGTTGLAAMDGLIADRWQVPEGAEAHYAERILRLPDGYVGFDPPADAPAVTPLPAGADRPLRFAAFHNPAKINPPLVALWSRALHAAPGSRLLFVYAGHDLPEVQARIAGWFAGHGIAADRLEFEGRLPRPALLARYNQTDIALDAQPYSGGVTTLEALWMGVPVVTLPGDTFAGRHALSHLSVTGLTETVARDADDYIAIIRRLDADRPHLAALRATLRARLAASPLCDGPRLASHLQTALRALWQARCA